MGKKVKKKELGLGIRALLSNMDAGSVDKSPEKKEEIIKELSASTAMIALKDIEVNPFQPRTEFDQDALKELSESLKVHGLIQPITVRRMGDSKYQLISGERRFRASKLAGLKEVPAYIRIANDQEMLEMALVENIQRAALNPVEIAITYQRLIEECTLTHEALADRVGKNRSSVTNYLRLLKLPPDVQKALKKGKISMGHARAIAGVDDLSAQLSLLKETLKNELSVRAVEALAKRYSTPTKTTSKKPKKDLPEDYQTVRNRLGELLETKVDLKLKGKNKGQFTVHFENVDQLNRILDILED